jgi:hypothetical protein
LCLKQSTGLLGLRRIVVQQSPQKDVGVDGDHAARLLAVTFERLLASASRYDSSSETARCLEVPQHSRAGSSRLLENGDSAVMLQKLNLVAGADSQAIA